MSLELTWFVISYSCGYDALKAFHPTSLAHDEYSRD